MATSGTYSFNLSVSQVITRALRISGIVGEGQTPTGDQYASGKESLSLLLQNINAGSDCEFKIEDYVYTFEDASLVSMSGSDFQCVYPHTADLTNRPITGPNAQQYWTSSSETGSEWVSGGSYTASNDFLLPAYVDEILEVQYQRNDNSNREVDIISYYNWETKYNKYSNKASDDVREVAFRRDYNQFRCYLYPVPLNNITGNLRFVIIRKFQDVTSNSQNVEMRTKYLQMIIYKLAVDLGYLYNRNETDLAMLMRQSSYYEKQYNLDNTEHSENNIVNGLY